MSYNVLPQWPKAYPETASQGLLKLQNKDFCVTEIPLISPSGEGEHVWLKVIKDGANTAYVARCLADYAKVKTMDVGYAGLKDRYAIAEQWFSVYLPKGDTPDFLALEHDEFSVISQHRHAKKCRPGDLIANHFVITLREIQGDPDYVEENLIKIRQQGAPNYFGPQRFGHHGANVQQGYLMLTRKRVERSQKKKSIYLSAVRSFVFNEILADRIKNGLWGKNLVGDVTNEQGSPTGALWGRGRIATKDAAAELEQATANRHFSLCESMEYAGLKQERRALVAIPANMTWQWLSDSRLQLEFSLVAGCYATSIIREILTAHEPDRFSD